MHAIFLQIELIACISFLVPLIPGWWLFRKMHASLRFLVVILSMICVFSVAGYYTGKHYMPNLRMYFVSYVLTFYLFSLLFRGLLRTKAARRITLGLMVLFAVFTLMRLHYILTPDSFDSYTPAFLSVAMMTYSVLYFNQQLDAPEITFIYKTPWFWVVTGLLLYYAGSFLILLTTDYLMVRDNLFIRDLWNLLDILTILRNLLIGWGLLWYKNTTWKTL